MLSPVQQSALDRIIMSITTEEELNGMKANHSHCRLVFAESPHSPSAPGLCFNVTTRQAALLQILLVIILSLVEGGSRDNLRHYRF